MDADPAAHAREKRAALQLSWRILTVLAPPRACQGDTGGPLANTIMADIGAAGPNGVAMGWGPEGP